MQGAGSSLCRGTLHRDNVQLPEDQDPVYLPVTAADLEGYHGNRKLDGVGFRGGGQTRETSTVLVHSTELHIIWHSEPVFERAYHKGKRLPHPSLLCFHQPGLCIKEAISFYLLTPTLVPDHEQEASFAAGLKIQLRHGAPPNPCHVHSIKARGEPIGKRVTTAR